MEPLKKAPGNQVADRNLYWWLRSQDWAEGAGQDGGSSNPSIDGSAITGMRLSDPHNYHSNPGYLGTSTGTALQMSSPGSIYRQPGGAGDMAHRPMPVGGRARVRTPGRTITPAGGAREPVSEGSPLVVGTGMSQF